MAGPIKLGTFITELIDVDNARIQEVRKGQRHCRASSRNSPNSPKTLEMATARNAELLEQNKLMAEQLAVKESQIVRLTELVEKAATHWKRDLR